MVLTLAPGLGRTEGRTLQTCFEMANLVLVAILEDMGMRAKAFIMAQDAQNQTSFATSIGTSITKLLRMLSEEQTESAICLDRLTCRIDMIHVHSYPTVYVACVPILTAQPDALPLSRHEFDEGPVGCASVYAPLEAEDSIRVRCHPKRKRWGWHCKDQCSDT